MVVRKDRDERRQRERERENGEKGNEGEEDRRENESAPCHECNRACSRRKIHDQDAIVT